MFAANLMRFSNSGGITFDAVGVGANLNNQSLSPQTISWAHAATAGAYVVTAVSTAQNSGLGIASIAATYDPTGANLAMTLLGTTTPNGTAYGKLALFGLASAPGGSKNISATATATSGAVTALTGGSTSYKGVTAASTVTTAVGASNSLSVSATGATNGVVVAAFGSSQTANGVTISGFNRTQRYLYNSISGADTPLIIGDTAATGSLSFTGTLSGPSCWWDGITVVLT